MKEETRKLLPGRLLLATSFLYLMTAVIRPERRGMFMALGFFFLCVAVDRLRRARTGETPLE